MLIRRLSPLTPSTPLRRIIRTMSKISIPHTERTAGEPRDDGLYRVTLDEIIEVNDMIRLFRLVPKERSEGFKFRPGQWLDVYTPNTPKAGGFTITSPPSSLHSSISNPTTKPHLELAIQKSPQNPPAAYLWQPASQILHTDLHVRVGGSFIFPPSPQRTFKRVVFVAGGVGVNPLMSMISQIAVDHERGVGGDFEVKFLYTVREPPPTSQPLITTEILFLGRIRNVIETLGERAQLKLFLTSSLNQGEVSSSTRFPSGLDVARRRITRADLMEMLGPVEERGDVLCYICGVPGMTDEFVEVAKRAEGIDERNVLFEKWW